MIKNVGFVGLGMMGLPIAKNIIKGGYNLFVGYHSNRGPAEEMEKLGATICETYKEVAQHSDFIITVVPNSAQVEETLFSENGLAKGAKPGTIIADMSTIDLFASRSFAERLAKQGVEFMDAPISGGPEGAAAATLAIMIGGKKEAFEETKPVFDIIGKTLFTAATTAWVWLPNWPTTSS